MEFGKWVEFAQQAWPIAGYFGIALLAGGWLSPLLPHRGDSYVIERSTKLKGQIDSAKYFGHKPSLSDEINLAVLNITRGAFIHRNLFHSRVNNEIKKLKTERRN